MPPREPDTRVDHNASRCDMRARRPPTRHLIDLQSRPVSWRALPVDLAHYEPDFAADTIQSRCSPPSLPLGHPAKRIRGAATTARDPAPILVSDQSYDLETIPPPRHSNTPFTLFTLFTSHYCWAGRILGPTLN